jgi:Tol biopolymer transport system component
MSGGTTNLWRQPIDGGAAAQVTHFAGGDAPATHAWSRDGKLIAMVRSVTLRDIVVIKDQRR